jgi:hypothetical protein
MDDKPCSKCKVNVALFHRRYCRDCRNAYMRANRPRYRDLSEEERRKSNCRSYTNVLIRRFAIIRGDCEKCGAPNAEAHHIDYDNPYLVYWMCTPCHRQLHRDAKRRAT